MGAETLRGVRTRVGNFANDNDGVSQGTPSGAKIFVIRDGRSLTRYPGDIRNAVILLTPSLVRNDETETKWARYILNGNNRAFVRNPMGARTTNPYQWEPIKRPLYVRSARELAVSIFRNNSSNLCTPLSSFPSLHILL